MLENELIDQLKCYDDIIFDLDNTLFDQRDYDIGAFEDIENNLLKLTQLPLVGLADFLFKLKNSKGANYRFLFNDALKEFKLSEQYLKVMLELYYQHDGRYITAVNSLLPLLDVLKNKSIFIVTNGPSKVQNKKIEKLGLSKIVAEIIICDPFQSEKLKPNKYAYEQLRKKHTLRNTIMVGDSLTTDGMFAENANIPFIHFTYKNKRYENM